MDFSSSTFWISLLQIIWIDLLLSGDNAVVIALACRSLPENRRKLGIWLGAGAAVGLRIIFALIVTYLLGVPYLKVIGGILLFWIAIKLAVGEEEAHGEIEASESLWKAVRTIAIADAVMSLDNVIAIAGAAEAADPQHRIALVIFGLLVSIPLIVWGSQLVLKLLDRFPIVITLGAALLGWIAGGLIINDPAGDRWPVLDMPAAEYGMSIACALFVVIVGYALKRRNARRESAQAPPGAH